jgi:hypothetical protein
VLKENGGQASAFNAGLRASRGDVVLFLDSDDVLLPTAVECAVRVFERGRPAKVHWPLLVIDAQGRRTGPDLGPGEAGGKAISAKSPAAAARRSARAHPRAATPGRAASWSASSPCPRSTGSARDDYLYALAPDFGPIGRIGQPQGCYRLPGRNQYLTKGFDERLELGCRIQDQQCAVLERYFAGLDVRRRRPRVGKRGCGSIA